MFSTASGFDCTILHHLQHLAAIRFAGGPGVVTCFRDGHHYTIGRLGEDACGQLLFAGCRVEASCLDFSLNP